MSHKSQKDQVDFHSLTSLLCTYSMLLSCCMYILWVLQLKDLSHKLIRDRTDRYKRSKQQTSPSRAAAAALSSSAAAGTTGQQLMSPKLLALINNLPVCPHSLLKYLIYNLYIT